MAGIGNIITDILGIGAPSDEENLQKADDLVSMLTEQQGFITPDVTALEPRRETQQAGLASTAGIPQIGDAPVVGPVLDFAVNKVTPIGALLRMLTPEGGDVFLGGEPTGARPWDWKAGPGRSALESGMRPEFIQQQLVELDLPAEDKRKYLNQMQRIIDLRSAETNYQRMMRNIGSEENPGGYDPEYMAGLEALRGARTEDGGHDPLSLSQFIDGVAAAESRRTGRLKEEARQRQETKEITAQEQAELNLEGKAIANQAARYNNKWTGWQRVRQDRVDPVTGMQELDANGQPILQDVMVKVDKRTGRIREVVLPGQITDRQALRPTPEAASQARLAESVTQRLFTEEQQLATFGSAVMSAGQSLSPWLTALKDGSAIKIGSRGTLGNVIRTLSGVADQARKLHIMEANPGFTLEQINAEAARIGDSLKNIRLYDAEMGKWLLPGKEQLVKISDIPKEFQAMGENDKKQSQAMIFLRNRGMSGIADRAERYSNIASEQAYYAGQEYQAAIVLAQLRSRGRISDATHYCYNTDVEEIQ